MLELRKVSSASMRVKGGGALAFFGGVVVVCTSFFFCGFVLRTDGFWVGLVDGKEVLVAVYRIVSVVH